MFKQKQFFEVSGNVTETENKFLDLKIFRHEQFYLLFYRSDSFDKNLGQTCIFYSQNTGITRMDALAEFNNHVGRLSVVCSE